RPDERHIRYRDVYELKEVISTEFNIEGNPMEEKFVELVLANQPTQVTLVPDTSGQLTSNHGWDTIRHQDYLKKIIHKFQSAGIRVSIFVDPDLKMVEAAASTGTDRIELYTEAYAINFQQNKEAAIQPYRDVAILAKEHGLGLNAGHDLDLNNLRYFARHTPDLQEVSIGHALVCDCLYLGMENTIQRYLYQLHP
ncbi:MAG: hypothetical protein RI924_1411, partial [Bacteroidota bacterium]